MDEKDSNDSIHCFGVFRKTLLVQERRKFISGKSLSLPFHLICTKDDCSWTIDGHIQIPLSNIPILNDWIICIADIVLITFLTVMNWFKLKLLKKLSKFRDFKIKACVFLTIMTIFWDILILTKFTNFWLTVYFRIIFVILYK